MSQAASVKYLAVYNFLRNRLKLTVRDAGSSQLPSHVQTPNARKA